ncbi:MAG: GNAT family N-acetyltransferase [Planctomycetota bacterium]|jgi:RimJ/RimL family protein N-acetyltransferase
MRKPAPVTLTGHHVRLEPLAEAHAEGLFAVTGPVEGWKYMPRPGFSDVEDVKAWITETVACAEENRCVPFAIVDMDTDTVVGTTRFALEIGWTWLGEPYRQTGFNTESKLLMLTHAFDELGAVRVQMKIDARNKQSRKAIEKVGALFEGILRKHMRRHDGKYRDTAYFSITDEEWPDVCRRLKERLHWGE